MTPAEIIEKWPSAEQFADDLGLKWRSHARVMKIRNSIPRMYWPVVVEAASRRGISVDQEALVAAHAKTIATQSAA